MNKDLLENKLNEIINQYSLGRKKVAVYGTGILASDIFSVLKKLEIDIPFFMDRENTGVLHNLPVVKYSEVSDSFDAVIISSLIYQDVIVENLVDVFGSEYEIIKLLPEKDWNAVKDEHLDFTKKTILFVKEGLHIRVQKLSLALKKYSDYNTILVTQNPADLIDSAFDKVYVYKSERGLRHLLRILDADICFAYDLPAKVPRIVIECVSYPVVYAMHDSPPSDWEGLKPEAKGYTTKDDPDVDFVLRNADGITYKGLELEWFRDKYKIPAYELVFNCYVMEEFFPIPCTKLSAGDGDIHVVQGGGVFSMKKDKQQWCDSQYLNIARIFTDNKIHYHLYPAAILSSEDYSDYYEFDSECEYFHFHTPLSYNDFVRELPKYDFAVPIHETRFKWDKPVWFDSILPSKIFAYIESGLPILTNLKCIGDFVEKYKIGKLVPLDELCNIGKIIRDLDVIELNKNLLSARENLNISNYINDMCGFICNVLQSGNLDVKNYAD